MYIKDKVQNKDPTIPADFREFINEVHYQATLHVCLNYYHAFPLCTIDLIDLLSIRVPHDLESIPFYNPV